MHAIGSSAYTLPIGFLVKTCTPHVFCCFCLSTAVLPCSSAQIHPFLQPSPAARANTQLSQWGQKSSGARCSKHSLLAVLFTPLCQPIKDQEVSMCPGGSICRMCPALCQSSSVKLHDMINYPMLYDGRAYFYPSLWVVCQDTYTSFCVWIKNMERNPDFPGLT